MLTWFRSSGLGQAGMVVMVGAISVVFISQMRNGNTLGPMRLSRDCAVEVNGSCVDPKDYVTAFRMVDAALNVRAQRRGTEITEQDRKQLQVRRAVLEGLIERELLIGEATRLGLSVSEKQVDDELANGRFRVSVKADNVQLGAVVSTATSKYMSTEGPLIFLDEQHRGDKFDFATFERVIEGQLRRPYKPFKEMQTRELLAERMRELVRSRAVVAEDEAFMRWEREETKATVRVASLQKAWFSRWITRLDDVTLDKWSTDHKAEVDAAYKEQAPAWKAECAQLREIRQDLLTSDEQGDAKLKAEKKAKLEDAKKRVEGGEDFGAVARELSQGAEAELGGELGCIDATRYGAGGQQLLDAAAKLKPGALELVETPRGFHLLQFVKRVPQLELEPMARRQIARPRALAEVAEKKAREFAVELIQSVAAQDLKVATEALAKIWVQRVYPPKAAEKAGDPMVAAAGELAALAASDRPKAEEVGPVGRSEMIVQGALPMEDPNKVAFELAVPGAVAKDPIGTSTGFAVMQLVKLSPAERKEFDKVKAELLEDLRRSKGDELLVQLLERLRRQAGDTIKLDSRLLTPPKDEDS